MRIASARCGKACENLKTPPYLQSCYRYFLAREMNRQFMEIIQRHVRFFCELKAITVGGQSRHSQL